MGETIIEKDCTGEGLPIFSADKSNRPWAYSTHFKRINKKGVIVIGARGTIGFPRLPKEARFGATQTTISFTPTSNGFVSEFVHYVLQGVDFELLGAQQAIPMLTVANLADVAIPEFTKLQQVEIVAIISTLDRAIEQTEALIAKQQRIKTGLMQDLLTKGIDAHGNIRSEATHAFKDSPLGRIPAEWDARLLDDCVRFDSPICYGILMPGTGVDDGVPVIKVKDIFDGAICLENLLLTDPKIDAAYKRSRLRTNDLLMTIRGTTGRVALVPPVLDGANITQDTARIRLKEEYLPAYFFYLLQSAGVQAQVDLQTLGEAVKGINISEVRKLRIAVPHRDEQNNICRILEQIHLVWQASVKYREKLLLQKTGLMKDLLTGDRRVTSLLAQASTK